jgi:hypothetical protein
VSRDDQTDASRDGSGQIQKRDVTQTSDFWVPISVAEETDLGGWDPKARPTGPGPLKRLLTSGNRGAADEAAEAAEGNRY